MIENGIDTGEIIGFYLSKYKDIDSIILGCTHYKLIENKIKGLNVINSSDGVVKEVIPFIKASEKSMKIYTTGNVDSFNKMCYKIIKLKAEKINI